MNFGNESAAKEQAYQRGEAYARAGEGAVLGTSDRYMNRQGDVAARQPETVRFLAELEKMLAMCGGSLDGLESRLERVTRPEAAAPEGSGMTPAPREVAHTQMGAGIQALIERAATLNARLMRLMQRIEV